MDDPKRVHTAAEQPGDPELVGRCLAGDAKAWEILLLRYERMISSVTVRFGFQLDDRNDIFQTVCCEILKNLPALIDIVKLRTWITTITIRESNDLLRKKYLQRRHDSEEAALYLEDPSAHTLEIYLRSERQQTLREAIAELPPRCQGLIRMLFLGDIKSGYEGVSQEFGLSKETVGSLRQRCLKKLRQILESRDF